MAGSVGPVMDVGDAIVPQEQPLTASPDDEEEADSSSDDEERQSNADGAGQSRYIVEKILGKRIVDGEAYLLTKWQGYRRADWQPCKNLDKTNVALMDFELKNATNAAESTDEGDDDYVHVVV
ncbi:Chromo domain containing protein [Aphelenchoides avenae]|nr:Chromo domain containing protein [Aphelenchus avenae]